MEGSVDWEAMRSQLSSCGQEHLLRHVGQLSESEKAALHADLAATHWEKLGRLWRDAKKSLGENGEVKDDRLKPLDKSILGSTAKNKDDVTRWSNIGQPVLDSLKR